MCAMMTSDEEDTERIRLEIEEAREKGIKILPPDVNESGKHFTFIDAHTIRFGLKAIKWLGEWPIDTICRAVEEVPFSSLYDFIERTGGDVINKKSLESLIYSGALDRYGERWSLLASMLKMSAYEKEIESKRETSQMWLFDAWDSISWTVHFELIKTEPLSFEAVMKWEKQVIGYPVSGHPLDGIEDFIRAKSKNLKVVLDWIERSHKVEEVIPVIMIETEIISQEEIETSPSLPWDIPEGETPDDEDIPPMTEEIVDTPPQEKELEENIYAQLIGVVSNVRKMQTKSGGMMMVATVESIGFDFRVVIFPKEYEKYESKILEDMIVVVDGRIRYDRESGEVSIFPSAGYGKKRMEDAGAVKCFSISVFRDMAESSGLSKIKNWRQKTKNEDMSQHWANPLSPTKQSKFTIDIPSFWTKEDLLDLRDYLESVPIGLIPIAIRIWGKEKDTKFTIENIDRLKEWVRMRGM